MTELSILGQSVGVGAISGLPLPSALGTPDFVVGVNPAGGYWVKSGATGQVVETNADAGVSINWALANGLDVRLGIGTFASNIDIAVAQTFNNLHGSGWGTILTKGAAWAGTNLITVSAGHSRVGNLYLKGDNTIAKGIATSVDPVLIDYILAQEFTANAIELGAAGKVRDSIIRLCPTGILVAANDCEVWDTEIGWATGIEYGIDCAGSTLRLIGNHIWQPTKACIRIKYGDVEIANSVLSESDLDGILIDTDLSGADISHLRIHDNWIRQQNTSAGAYDSIRVAGSFKVLKSNITVNNFNYTANQQRYCVSGAFEDSTIQGNTVKDSYATSPFAITGYNTIKDNPGADTRFEMEVNPLVKNATVGNMTEGMVVISGYPADGNFWQVGTTTSQGDSKVIGVIADATIVSNGVGRMVTRGKITTLKVNGVADIAVGDFLATYTSAGIACKAAAGNTAFAYALEAYTGDDSNGVIDALLIPPTEIH